MPSWSRQPPPRPPFARRAFQARMHVTAWSVSNRPCLNTRARKGRVALVSFETISKAFCRRTGTTERSPTRQGSEKGGFDGKLSARICNRDQVSAGRQGAGLHLSTFLKEALSPRPSPKKRGRNNIPIVSVGSRQSLSPCFPPAQSTSGTSLSTLRLEWNTRQPAGASTRRPSAPFPLAAA